MRVVVTGAGGQIGHAVAAAIDGAVPLDHGAFDVTSRERVQAMAADLKPDVIVHCAAWTDVDGCELDPERAMRVNGLAPSFLARDTDARIVYLSTDYVFDGRATTPYLESNAPNPLSVYGRSKLAGERALDLQTHAVVRTSWVCGDGNNLVRTILRLLEGDAPLRFATDQRANPTFVADLVPALIRFVREPRTGIWHVTNQGDVSAYEFAQTVAEAAGYSANRVEPTTAAEFKRPAPRPSYSVLASKYLAPSDQLPDFRESLPHYLATQGRL